MRRVLLLVVWGLLLTAAGCRREPGTPTPSVAARPGAPVVLVSIDTLRSDRLPAYGYGGVETPALDRFREDAVLFERAYSHYPLTFPSHVSLLTGQLPPETGVRDNAGYRLRPGHDPYLPRILQEAGYATGGFVSASVLRGGLGLAQGFDVYDDRAPETEAAELWGPERRGADTLATALPWVDEVVRGGRPFFLFFHLYEPHVPWEPPEPFRQRWGETYEGEIAAADAVVGELLAALRQRGVYQDALIVVLSDHGEGLEDHLERVHGVFLYREAIQVPLLVKLPGNRHAGVRVAAPAQLADVVPTVHEVLGLAPRPEWVGLPLTRLLAGEFPERTIFAETQYPRLHFGWSDLASLVRGRFHYIAAPTPELYDLEADPGETRNVLRENRRVYVELRDAIETFRRPLEAPQVEEDPQVRAQLAALGYASGARAVPQGDLPDPKEQFGFIAEKMDAAEALAEQGEPEQALGVLAELLEHNPRATDAWQMRAGVLERLGRLEESLAAWQTALQLSRGGAETAVRVGLVLLKLGRIEEARGHAELAAVREPALARALSAELALAEGRLPEALRLLQQAVADGAARPDLRRRVALAFSRRGDHAVALPLLQELATEDPSAAARNAYAIALVAAGRAAAARPLLEELLSEDAEDSLAHETSGLVALQDGRLALAARHLEKAVDLDPEAANAWNLLGVARFEGQDANGALEAWRRAVDLDPEQLDALYNLAFTAARRGRREEARQRLRQYLASASPERYRRERAEAEQMLRRLGGA